MLEISVDLRPMLATLGNLAERQLPFATMKSLNECATLFQAAEQREIQNSFIIRRPWVLQGVKIERSDFATKQKLSVKIKVDHERDFLNKFEEGGVRTPIGNSRALAVPVNVRRTKAQIISKTQTPKSFHFTRGFSSRKSQWTILKGDRRTFLLQRPDGFGVILTRTGSRRHRQHGRDVHGQFTRGARGLLSGRDSQFRRWGHDPNLTIVWALVAQTAVPRTLHFYETANQSLLTNWPRTFTKWWNTAIATANPSG